MNHKQAQNIIYIVINILYDKKQSYLGVFGAGADHKVGSCASSPEVQVVVFCLERLDPL